MKPWIEDTILGDPTCRQGRDFITFGETPMMTYDPKQISLEDFVALEVERIQRFADAYAAGMDRDYENDAFPPEMTDFEWIAAYESWVETIYSEEDEVIVSNENNSDYT